MNKYFATRGYYGHWTVVGSEAERDLVQSRGYWPALLFRSEAAAIEHAARANR